MSAGTPTFVRASLLKTILAASALWLCCAVCPAQIPTIPPVQISSPGLVVGQSNCIIVTTSNPGPVAVVVELDGIAIRKTLTPLSESQAEVCFLLPPGARGGDLTVTATSGGHSACVSWIVP